MRRLGLIVAALAAIWVAAIGRHISVGDAGIGVCECPYDCAVCGREAG